MRMISICLLGYFNDCEREWILLFILATFNLPSHYFIELCGSIIIKLMILFPLIIILLPCHGFLMKFNPSKRNNSALLLLNQNNLIIMGEKIDSLAIVEAFLDIMWSQSNNSNEILCDGIFLIEIGWMMISITFPYMYIFEYKEIYNALQAYSSTRFYSALDKVKVQILPQWWMVQWYNGIESVW